MQLSNTGIKLVKNCITPEQVAGLLTLYRTSNNTFYRNDQIVDRFYPSTLGHFIIAEFSEKEFGDVIDSVRPAFDISVFTSIRILKYTKGCYIQPHVDAGNGDISIVIQLSSPDEYLGGETRVEEQPLLLQPGDAAAYPYGIMHDVSIITAGTRYVVNIRGECNKY